MSVPPDTALLPPTVHCAHIKHMKNGSPATNFAPGPGSVCHSGLRRVGIPLEIQNWDASRCCCPRTAADTMLPVGRGVSAKQAIECCRGELWSLWVQNEGKVSMRGWRWMPCVNESSGGQWLPCSIGDRFSSSA